MLRWNFVATNTLSHIVIRVCFWFLTDWISIFLLHSRHQQHVQWHQQKRYTSIFCFPPNKLYYFSTYHFCVFHRSHTPCTIFVFPWKNTPHSACKTPNSGHPLFKKLRQRLWIKNLASTKKAIETVMIKQTQVNATPPDLAKAKNRNQVLIFSIFIIHFFVLFRHIFFIFDSHIFICWSQSYFF